MSPLNRHGQPVGNVLPGWQPRSLPPRAPMPGRFCTVEPFDVALHGATLEKALSASPDDRDWTYLPDEKPTDAQGYATLFAQLQASTDPMHHAIVETASGHALGACAFMRIDARNGVIEIGAIRFAQALQRRTAGTEAIFLMMRRAFDELGYRRCEWKCDHLNAPSRRAAERYGFRLEGIFRQAVVVKGRNRDTAWYSVTDAGWPALRRRFELWLEPANFHPDGGQIAPLAPMATTGATDP